LNVPIKKLHIETTWLVLRGLKNKWIELIEHQSDEAPKNPVVRKCKVSAMESTRTPQQTNANDSEEEEEEEEETDDEDDEEVDEDELIDDPSKFFDDDDDEDDDDYEA
jgi:ribosomal protein L12E/L44/L45/RPP1/RPP2